MVIFALKTVNFRLIFTIARKIYKNYLENLLSYIFIGERREGGLFTEGRRFVYRMKKRKEHGINVIWAQDLTH